MKHKGIHAPQRHINRGLCEGTFEQGNIWVECPRCQQAGLLKSVLIVSDNHTCAQDAQSRFFCTQYHYLLDHQYGQVQHAKPYVYASQRCPHGGGSWLNLAAGVSNPGHPQALSGQCDVCHKASMIKS